MHIREEHLSGDKILDVQHVNILILATKISAMARSAIQDLAIADFSLLEEALLEFSNRLIAHSRYEEYLIEALRLPSMVLNEQKRTHKLVIDRASQFVAAIRREHLEQIAEIAESIYVNLNEANEIALIFAIKRYRKSERL